jgi:uncharacterized protein YndB with AHSA1/START domain
MPYDYTLTTVIPASAREIYDAWLDSLAHSEMTGGRAMMSGELGAEFSAWDGYITGRNLELVPGARIVQSWRTTKFREDHEDSIITVTFEQRDDGTLLTLSHSNVPETHVGYEQGGWRKSYFEPMIAYFSGRTSAGGKAAPQGAARQPTRQGRPKHPVGKKKAVAPKASPKRPATRKKSVAKKLAAPKARPERASARAKQKSATSKKAAAKKRAKSVVHARVRAGRDRSARRKLAARGRRK